MQKELPQQNPVEVAEVKVWETDIQSAEAALATLEDELADPAAWSTPERSAKSSKRHEQAKRAVEQLYEELATLEA